MENWLGQNSFIGVWITLEDGIKEQVFQYKCHDPALSRLQMVFVYQNNPAQSYHLFAFSIFGCERRYGLV